MKFIKTIIYVFICLLSFSCTEEWDKQVIIPETRTIVGDISVSGTQFSGGLSVPFTITLPETFNKKAVVTVVSESVEFVNTSATVTIDAGASSGMGSITLPSVSGSLKSFDAVADFVTIKISGISLKDEVDDGNGNIELVQSSEDDVVLTSNIISISYFNLIASDALQATSMSYLFDWSDPAKYDIDIQVIDRAFTAIFENSDSGDRYESDFFNSFHPDGDYDMYARIYGVSDPTTSEDIPFKIFTLHPDGTRELFEGVIPSGSPTGGARIDIADIIKTGNTYQLVLN